MNKINKLINKELTTFDKSIVATPKNRAALDAFAQANQGSADVVLTQMAVQFGYNEALRFLKQEINI